MCRLFGLASGSDPVSATFWLLDAPESLRVQSRREPDGTGLGWIDVRGRAHVRKQPLAAFQDRAFAHEARTLEACTFIAHVRFASTGALERVNTHPFEQSGRLFAHNGVLGGLPQIEERLGQERELVKGDTDSERLFALITKEVEAHDGDIGAGVEAACRWVAAELPLYAINLLLASAEGLWALRYPETHPLYVLERRPGEPVRQSSELGTTVHAEDGSRRPLVVFASERMDEDPGWSLLASGELVHVDRELRIERRRILDGPPAHPIELGQLGARAQASQASQASAS